MAISCNPENPYTGDGKKTRDIYDTPHVIFRDKNGKKLPFDKSKPKK